MRSIDFITATFPPWVSGVGDHTAYLATEMAKTYRVRVLSSRGVPSTPLPGVEVDQVFDLGRLRGTREIAVAVAERRPDWLILQYDPYSFGMHRYSFDPLMPLTIRKIRTNCPSIRIALVAHETVTTISGWKSALMAKWQGAQLRALGGLADVVFFPIEAWVQRFAGWFPNKPVVHLPVGSNIPRIASVAAEERKRLNIGERAVVLGLFGRVGRSRSLDCINAAVAAASRVAPEVVLLYIGPDAATIHQSIYDVSLIADGPLSTDEVSRRFASMDVYLVPIDEGISTRRTSLMAGLQHEVAVVATSGTATDDLLHREDGQAFLLAEAASPDRFGIAAALLAADPSARQGLARAGRLLFDREYRWDRIAARLTSALELVENLT